MTKEEITIFEKTIAQLDSFYTDTAVLVKKDPKAEMNPFKLKLINKILVKANDILGNMKPFDDFSEFDLDEIPNNGDVAMVLGQYISCLEGIKKDNIHYYSGRWYWIIDGDTKNYEILTYISSKYNK